MARMLRNEMAKIKLDNIRESKKSSNLDNDLKLKIPRWQLGQGLQPNPCAQWTVTNIGRDNNQIHHFHMFQTHSNCLFL